MDINDKVSVIIPVWDQPKLVVRALHSVTVQTHQNWEALVVGDGCPPDVMDQYAYEIARFQDDRITLHNLSDHQPCTKSTTGARPRNYGLDLATGNFIAPLDDDDMWMPYHLEDCLKIIREEGADFVYGQFVDVGMKRRYTIIHGRSLEEGFEKSLIGHPTVVYNAKYKHLKYATKIRRGGADRQLWTAIHQAGAKMHFSPKVHAIHYSKVV